MISDNQSICPKCGGQLKYYDHVQRLVPYCNGSPNYVGIKNEAYSERTMGNRIR